MSENLLESLRSHFGFDSFRAGQLDAIESLLSGQHALVVMPTGSGKSLIYQLAALHLPGQTLVISPLIALMKDQVDALNRRGIPATYVNSALSSEEQTHRLEAMARGDYRLVYVAPERLRSVPFREALEQVEVSLLAVDEAHCISQWGHDFRPDYLHIIDARERLNGVLTAALTATATPRVQNEIIQRLAMSPARMVVTGFNRPNLTFCVDYTPDEKSKFKALQQLLDATEDGAAIVYVGTRRDAEEVSDFIETVCGSPAPYYHAGLGAELRTQVQDAFMTDEVSVVVATNAFGMGIDRPDVRLVVHFAMPGTLEAYYQEAGRAGRDGRPSQAVLLYSPKDRALQEWFIENDAPVPAEVKTLYTALRRQGGSEMWVSWDDLSLLSGLAEMKIKVALEQLEAAGSIERFGDAGTRVLLRVGAWNEKSIRQAHERAQIRRQHRLEQLERMIQYAESNDCRRRILLAHFGDDGSAEAERCCDNCLARQSVKVDGPAQSLDVLSEPERVALAILDTVYRLSWDVGRDTLTRVLYGSKAEDIRRVGYDRKSCYYGRLAGYTQKQITKMIDQLIDAGYFKVIGGKYPLLRLTPQGVDAIKKKASIPLRLSQKVSPLDNQRRKTQRQAGGTIELTAQLFAQGLKPSQIAEQRGLIEETVYLHFAHLIAQGRVPLSQVISEDVATKVRAAIESLGETSYLSPIKARLPGSISFGQIRCVIEDLNRGENTFDNTSPRVPPQERLARVVNLGNERSPNGLPELIEALKDANGNVRRLAASALGKIRDRRAVTPLLELLSTELKPQVRQYAVKALGTIRDPSAQSVLENIANDPAERDYTRLAARCALRRLPLRSASKSVAVDPIHDFLSRSHPRKLLGSWEMGWALDFHSRIVGDEGGRSAVGELVHRLKYQSDLSAVQPLLGKIRDLFEQYPHFAQVDALVTVPPSEQRRINLVGEVAAALGRQLDLPVWVDGLVKTRKTASQKDMTTRAQKRTNVAGAFATRADVRGKRLLVIDDLFDSGATLEEVSRVLRRAGAATLHVLALTRTIHVDA